MNYDWGRFTPTHVGNSPAIIPWWAPSTVHPHACGELDTIQITEQFYNGSSPRMWGTHRKVRLQYRTLPVDPHACGELKVNVFVRYALDGSSPRMWGTHRGLERASRHSRFIPTHVGNSADTIYYVVAVTVHPHACGELIKSGKIIPSLLGSSPRMWGTRKQ